MASAGLGEENTYKIHFQGYKTQENMIPPLPPSIHRLSYENVFLNCLICLLCQYQGDAALPISIVLPKACSRYN